MEDLAHQVADLVAQLPDRVSAWTGALTEVKRREAFDRLWDILVGIKYGIHPVLEWIERNRHPETADRLNLRVTWIGSEAIRWAKLGKPQWGTEPFPRYPHPLPPEAADVATLLHQWSAELAGGEAAGRSAEEPAGGQGPVHSDDFRSIKWYGTEYTFTATQAACVKVLWENWERGTPEVGDATVLESADSDSDRLDRVFKDHAGWGAMILPGTTKGTHRLSPPRD